MCEWNGGSSHQRSEKATMCLEAIAQKICLLLLTSFFSGGFPPGHAEAKFPKRH